MRRQVNTDSSLYGAEVAEALKAWGSPYPGQLMDVECATQLLLRQNAGHKVAGNALVVKIVTQQDQSVLRTNVNAGQLIARSHLQPCYFRE